MTDLRHCNAIVCSESIPRADGDGSARRLFHVVGFLRDAGCGVTCVVWEPRDVANPAAGLRALGVNVSAGDEGHVTRLAGAERFDWAVLGSWSVAERLVTPLRAAAPGASIVVDAGAMRCRWHADRMLREADGRLGEDSLPNSVRELEVYAAADGVLAASRADADLVADLIGDRRRIFVVPDSEDLAASPFPFQRRRGMLCAGDFAARSDVDALAHLGDDILPHVDPAVLADHQLSVAGSHMTDDVRGFAADWPTVRMLGRVPSLVPYLQRVRAVLLPEPHGARAGRTLLQALAIGTPVVATTAAIADLPLTDERDVLLADDPVRFAAAITRLLTDETLWNDLARAGRATFQATHGHAVARRMLREALVAIRTGTPAAGQPTRTRRMMHGDYDAALERLRDAIVHGTPPGAVVAVVSRGDEEAVRLEGRTGWHFPLDDQGDYAGCYPATGSEAVEHLEAVRRRGAEFLAIPAPSLWWLGHYGDLRAHLEAHTRVIEADGRLGVIVSLHERPAVPQSLEALAAGPAADDDRPVTIDFVGLSDRHTVTRAAAGPAPALSVVIAAPDRSDLLAEALDGLARQTVAAATVEVVVVSDGSTDGIADACRAASDRLRLTFVESPPAGTAVARNLGVDAAAAPLVLFLAADVVADPGLVAAHLAAHRRYPLEHVAVRGSTTWHPRLPATALMRFLTDEAHRLFGTAPVDDGRPPDATAFRAIGASLKKSLLVRAGGFRPECSGGAEDLEAAYRVGRLLARERPPASGFAGAVGLAVVACRDATQHAIRPITTDEFSARCERQGRAHWRFSRIADDPCVDAWLGASAANERWRDVRTTLAAQATRAHDLERQVAQAGAGRGDLEAELHALYAWIFEAFRTKGMAEAADVV